jgi:hypothetical protein
MNMVLRGGQIEKKEGEGRAQMLCKIAKVFGAQRKEGKRNWVLDEPTRR